MLINRGFQRAFSRSLKARQGFGSHDLSIRQSGFDSPVLSILKNTLSKRPPVIGHFRQRDASEVAA